MIGTQKTEGRSVMAEVPGFPFPLRTIPKRIRIQEPEDFHFVDPDVLPFFEKEELEGLEVRAIFDHQSLPLFVDEGDVAVYIGDLIEACEHKKRFRVAEQLSKRMTDQHALVVFQFASYDFL